MSKTQIKKIKVRVDGKIINDWLMRGTNKGFWKQIIGKGAFTALRLKRICPSSKKISNQNLILKQPFLSFPPSFYKYKKNNFSSYDAVFTVFRPKIVAPFYINIYIKKTNRSQSVWNEILNKIKNQKKNYPI